MTSPRFSNILRLILGLAIAMCLGARAPATGSSTNDEQNSQESERIAALGRDVTQGALRVLGEDGSILECPLKHTDVKADVTGFIARVNVTQTFQNPSQETIEAVYVFPLPHEAAVDNMTMVIGERKIVGMIKRRDEARRIYEQALMQGQTAALLEQERPNIFTQSVGNIAPGQEVRIQISYVDVLKYDMGEYEFQFPMVVGPRFIPGAPVSSPDPTSGALRGKVSPPVANTTRVPDAERISPPVLRPEVRNGHDISLTFSLDAGVPVQNVTVTNHQANINRDNESKATVKLSPADSLPNKDFVVRYDVVGTKPELAVLAHTGSYSDDANKLGSGYLMLMIQPREDERLKKSPPREMVFLVDVSGSMRGAKTAKTRETMQHMLGLCRDKDTVQVITFANQANKLFPQPLPVNENSIRQALNFTGNMRGSGGTRMLQGVKLAIDEPIDNERLRIIVMLTDGFIGNEAEIIQHVGKYCGDQIRFWAIGIGQSPNMFLVDGVAKQGGGMGKLLGLNDEAESLSHEVMTRIQRAQLAKVQIDWGNFQVSETYPARLPELWAGRPVIVFGRYTAGGNDQIHVSGTIEGEPVSWPLTVELPNEQPAHDVLAKVWARRKIEDLMQQTYYFGSPAVEEEVTAIALDYRLMSQYTSFVAVDERESGQQTPTARPPRRMLVPVPLPEGAEWEGFFGERHVETGFSFGVPFGRGSVATDRLAGLALAPAGGQAGYGGRARFASPVNQPAMPAAPQPVTSSYFRQLRRVPTEMAGKAALSSPARARSRTPALRSNIAAGTLATSSGLGITLTEQADSGALGEAAVPAPLQALNYTIAVLRTEAEQSFKSAQAAMNAAKELKARSQVEAARVAFSKACFFDQAAANFGHSGGQLAAEALAKLEDIHREQVSSRTKELPGLANRLDLVLRDQSIAAALQQVAAASDMRIELVPGSVADAESLIVDTARVSYLDLRGATVAQALDWILQPVRLGWRCEQDGIVAGADRRLRGQSAWVYDVSRIALPTSAELGETKDNNKALATAKAAADGFIGVVRRELRADDDAAVVWFAAGQLLVLGGPDRHEQVGKLLAQFADPEPKARLRGEAGKLQRITAKRAEQSKDRVTKLTAARRRARIARSHAAFGWQLLASAARGQYDDEAATELQIAWKDPATRELLEGKGRALAMRSLWLVTEASRTLPDESTLAALAKFALDQARPFFESVRTEATNNADAYAALLYSSLALRDDADLRAQALQLLTKVEANQSTLRAARLLGLSLLTDPDELDRAALVQLVSEGVAGEDMVALAAIACRRAGGEAWQALRAESRDMLGSQPLPGHLVVLVHRLAEDRLPLTHTTH